MDDEVIECQPFELTDYSAVEIRYNYSTPIWEVLDELSNFFESQDLPNVDIFSITPHTDAFGELSLNVIYYAD